MASPCLVAGYNDLVEQMNSRKIPEFDSIKELARFWENHEFTEFEDELEEVEEPVFTRSSTVSIRLLPEEIEALGKIAAREGIAPEELVRDWVLQKLEA